MSNCSEHKKDLFGQTDMKLVAEAIGDLHYETLRILLFELAEKLRYDQWKDYQNGRVKIADEILKASHNIDEAGINVYRAYEISKPFMESNKTIKT